MTAEINTAREYSEQSEQHARRILKAVRHAITKSREEISRAEQRISRNLDDINDVKRVMYERGWSE